MVLPISPSLRHLLSLKKKEKEKKERKAGEHQEKKGCIPSDIAT
jgi:hypothetical protein